MPSEFSSDHNSLLVDFERFIPHFFSPCLIMLVLAPWCGEKKSCMLKISQHYIEIIVSDFRKFTKPYFQWFSNGCSSWYSLHNSITELILYEDELCIKSIRYFWLSNSYCNGLRLLKLYLISFNSLSVLYHACWQPNQDEDFW